MIELCTCRCAKFGPPADSLLNLYKICTFLYPLGEEELDNDKLFLKQWKKITEDQKNSEIKTV